MRTRFKTITVELLEGEMFLQVNENTEETATTFFYDLKVPTNMAWASKIGVKSLEKLQEELTLKEVREISLILCQLTEFLIDNVSQIRLNKQQVLELYMDLVENFEWDY